MSDANHQNNKTIDQSPDRFIATVPLLKTFTEAELRKLESLIVAELNTRAAGKAWANSMEKLAVK